MRLSGEEGCKREISNKLDSHQRTRCGIELAQSLGIDAEMIRHTRQMLKKLEKTSEDDEFRARSLRRASEKRRIIFRVALQAAKLVKEDSLNMMSLLALKEELLNSLDSLDDAAILNY